MGTSLFFATPRTKDVERRPCLTNTHTYTLYSSSFHGYFSPQISCCDPHPTVFLSSSFFLWIQTGFEAKAAFNLSCFVNLPTNLPALTSNFTVTLKKYTQMMLELLKGDQVLLLEGFNDVLSLKRDDGKRFFSVATDTHINLTVNNKVLSRRTAPLAHSSSTATSSCLPSSTTTADRNSRGTGI